MDPDRRSATIEALDEREKVISTCRRTGTVTGSSSGAPGMHERDGRSHPFARRAAEQVRVHRSGHIRRSVAEDHRHRLDGTPAARRREQAPWRSS